MKKDTWNFNDILADTDGIYFRPTLDSGKLYGIDIRFNTRLYNTSRVDFEDVAVAIFRRSRRALAVLTDRKMFKSGLIYVMVDIWKYDQSTVTDVLKFLVDEVFASIKRVTTSDLDPC